MVYAKNLRTKKNARLSCTREILDIVEDVGIPEDHPARDDNWRLVDQRNKKKKKKKKHFTTILFSYLFVAHSCAKSARPGSLYVYARAMSRV